MYKEALKIAYEAHDGQLRRESCVPYIVHPLRVANQFNDDFRKTIAILHDVIEDCNITKEYLEEIFGAKVAITVDILSKKKDAIHLNYIRNIKNSTDIAIEIKIADIVDNLTDTLSVQPESMIKRYKKSLEILIK